MPAVVIYYSKTGNTKKIAEAIARGAKARCEPVEKAEEVMKGADLFFIGTPVHSFGPSKPILEFLRKTDWSGKKVALFCTYAGLGNRRTLRKMAKEIEKRGGKVVGEFWCKGRFKFLRKGKPDAEDERKAEEFGRKVVSGQGTS
ncbi:MAG: flavodoxin family protein [Candidatus Hadarchaeales archaeon]